MSKITGWIKEHPVASGCVLAGSLLLLVVLLFSGSKQSASTVTLAAPASTDTGATEALQQAQVAAGVALGQAQFQAQTDQAAIAASQAVALAQNGTALQNIVSTADTSKTIATLQAQVADNQTAAAKAINDASVSGAVQVAQINATAQMQIAGLQADVSKYALNEDQFKAELAQNVQLRALNNNQAIASWLIGAGAFGAAATTLSQPGQAA